jgi:hypothetical protein
MRHKPEFEITFLLDDEIVDDARTISVLDREARGKPPDR